jgi:hypothetical protein
MHLHHEETIRFLRRDPNSAQIWRDVVWVRDPAACWVWRGSRNGRGRPVTRLGYRVIAAVRATWFAALGEYPIAQRLQYRCGNEDCVRPSHVRWNMTRSARRGAAALSDGYWESGGDAVVALECAAAAGAGAASVDADVAMAACG